MDRLPWDALRDWLPIVGALLILVVIAHRDWAITRQQGKNEVQRAQAMRELAAQRTREKAGDVRRANVHGTTGLTDEKISAA